MNPRILSLVVLLGLPMLAGAQSPKLLKDINQQPKLSTSYPDPMWGQDWVGRPRFTALGSQVLVAAETPATGMEIYVVDVRTGTSRLLKDINPGSLPSKPRTVCMTRDGKSAFFYADDGKTGAELWVTDGTTAGTRLVKDLVPGIGTSDAREIVAIGASSVILSAATRAKGAEIFVSDGTATGTYMLRDIGAGAISSHPKWLRCTADGKQVYFQATDSSNGAELWVTDGTKAGTKLVKDLSPGSGSSKPTRMTPLGASRMLLNANASLQGQRVDLWVSDGTTAGTKAVFPASDYTLEDAVTFGNRVLLLRTGASHLHPHLTDGTPQGTFALLSSCYEGLASPHVDTSGKRIYWHSTWNCSYQLIVSDGTPQGTGLLHPANRLVRPASMVELGGKLYFEGQDCTPGTGKELCVSDGTTQGTKTYQDLWPGLADGRARFLTRIDPKRAVFVANDGKAGTEFWILEIGKPPLLVDIDKPKVQGTKDSDAVFWFRYGPHVLFSAGDGIGVRQIWQTDGTGAGTVPSTNRHPLFHGGKMVPTVESAELGGMHFFIGTTAATGDELWVSDGTQAGTRLLKDLWPGPQSSWIRNMTTVGSRVYFSSDSGGGGHEPWVTDGTAKGTYQLAEIASGATGSHPAGFCGIGDRVVFRAFTFAQGWEPYFTDGTRAGTRLLKDIYPGVVSSNGGWGVMMEGKVYFGAYAPATGYELWVTDFTTAGTQLVMDLVPGAVGSGSGVLGARNGRLYLAVKRPTEDYSLWVTDGSAAGTRLFMGHKGRPDISEFKIPVGSRRVGFTTRSASRGQEPALTDGTSAGTHILEIVPGPVGGLIERSSGYVEWITLGSRLLIPGQHPAYGREIFVIDNGATAEPVGTSVGSNWLQGSDPILGQTATLEAGTGLSQAIHVTMIGALAPRSVQIGKAGSLLLDLSRPIVLLGTDQGPRFKRTVPVPSAPALRGTQLMVQVLSFDARNLNATMELSNGLHWVLGY